MGDASCAYYHGNFEAEVGNFEEAEKAFRFAIDQGHIKAAFDLFALIAKTESSNPDVAKLISILEKGVELGNPMCASNLAMVYFRGSAPYDLDQFDAYLDQPQEFRQDIANLFEARRLLERSMHLFINNDEKEEARKIGEVLLETDQRIAGLRRTHGLEVAGIEGSEQQQANETKARMEADELYQKWLIRDMQRRDNARIQNSLGK